MFDAQVSSPALMASQAGTNDYMQLAPFEAIR